MSALPAGTRVRLNADNPWTGRAGCEGTVVDGPDVYPWHGCGRNEVVVLLDDDPLGATRDKTWTCVLHRRSVTVLPRLRVVTA